LYALPRILSYCQSDLHPADLGRKSTPFISSSICLASTCLSAVPYCRPQKPASALALSSHRAPPVILHAIDDAKRALPEVQTSPARTLSNQSSINPIGHLASQGNTTAGQIESYPTLLTLPDVSLALLPLPLAHVTSHNNIRPAHAPRPVLLAYWSCNRATKRLSPCLAVPPCYTLQLQSPPASSPTSSLPRSLQADYCVIPSLLLIIIQLTTAPADLLLTRPVAESP
jgi:hypothetical protein